ncbi:Phosphocarrier protein HPr /dihydroxyacetone kinase DhaM subunit [Agromyces sp. CF514]|uniref:dihydroxyacetone kinase phosphoryl donor subunit DhaM n=1 Tax=Agromyces sp. CF514 TaxID=1881031 RepID=UPI0008E80864|nr:dihydroxyacetone kinase phosphoryl donor subunit DhaM [Agromyces sp. CF514]SFR77864.1 Phosphocarrier protein HPr /dihydroxyacetone kinase DhaM subunit [Agromyces sp. CF514]
MPEVADGERVGLVFVSHSAKIAEGLVDLAAQMAPSVALVAAGGTDDGRIGTSFDRVSSAIGEADAGAGVVVLCDLGSAILTTETALDFLDDEVRSRVVVADAPLVEGGVAAAVAAEAGEALDAVVAAARSAVGPGGDGGAADAPDGRGDGGAAASVAPSDAISASTGHVRRETITNDDGLHARPAAELVKLASTFDARVTVNGTDARSLLAIMALGLTKGATIEIASDDPDGGAAVDAVAALVQSGFGEH